MISRVNVIKDPQTGKIIVQTPLPPITCLALEGGGSRCAAYVGCYKVLVKTGIMDEVIHVSGTSGGAIFALAIALGYGSDEVKSILLDFDLSGLLESGQSALKATSWYSAGKTLLSILRSETYSLSTGNKFLEWLRSKIKKKMGSKHATFADLAKRVAEQTSRQYKYLYVTGTNLSLELPECKHFSHETTPDMELALAVYISSCIPGVFALMEYDGCLWADGGLLRNLPTKIFDEGKYLPKGYGFNEKGLNPGVLALKVDTKSEINQVLYGILKKVDLTYASNVATALYNALSQNIDIDEIREGRMTIALQDNNLGMLEFSVNTNGKIALISSAEKETQEFVENYHHSIYNVKTYHSVSDWLNAISLDEIDDTIAAYESMLNHENENANAPSREKIAAYIRFLDIYLRYRRRLKRDPDCELKIPVPDHINIPPHCCHNEWSKNVENEMKEKLKHIIQQIKYIDGKIESMKVEFNDLPVLNKQTLLHHLFYFDSIQALTSLVESRKLLYHEKTDLRVKLGMKAANHHAHNKKNNNCYADFIRVINPLLGSCSTSKDIVSILPDHLPILKYEVLNYGSPAIFTLDLQHKTDRMLYLIAALLFLDYKKSKNKGIFIRLYQDCVSQQVSAPCNMKELNDIFPTSKVELLMTAYRIESLLHFFEKKYDPECTPAINLDNVFGSSKLHKIRKSENADNKREIPMKHIIHSSSIFASHSPTLYHHSEHSGSSGKYSSETKSDAESDSDSKSEPRPKGFKKPTWFN